MVASVAVLVTDALLPFLAAIGGAAAGLLLARAVVPVSGRPALTRPTAVRGAVAVAVAGVVVAAAGIWIVARLQGGVLDPIDHFAQTSGVLLPVTALVAAIAAGWGANAGPVQP